MSKCPAAAIVAALVACTSAPRPTTTYESGGSIAAAKAGDKAKQTDADARWHTNAADIATFLSGANPNWPRQTLLDMLNEHLAVTTPAVARLERRWDDDVAAFDKIFNQAMSMADALSNGIVKQFPTRF